MELDPYLNLLGLISLLFFLPKMAVRIGIPSPVTEMALGFACGPAVLGLVERSELLDGLAAFGISALFLFAGLEVTVADLIKRSSILVQHVLLQALLIAAAAWVGVAWGLSVPVAVLAGAALMSSSAGFIVPALEALGFPRTTTSWIKQKAISAELLAILAVLVFSQSGTPRDLAVGVGVLVALIAVLPAVFWVFHHTILRWAKGTEFSFMMVIALLAAYVTHHLGVHYLVGAFVVGLVARRYLLWSAREGVAAAPVMTALSSFRFFSMFFLPFFFFLAGLSVPAEGLGRQSLIAAGVLLLAILPLRVLVVMVHRKLAIGESWHEGFNVGLMLGPTTVFSVAVAGILQDRFDVPDWLLVGLILYGAATSMTPLLTMQVRSVEYEDLVDLWESTHGVEEGEEGPVVAPRFVTPTDRGPA